MYGFLSVMHCVAHAICQTPEQVTSFQIGHEDAKKKVYLYVSFSCAHCAHFFKEILPELEDEIHNKKVVFNIRIGSFTMIDALIAYGFSILDQRDYRHVLNAFYEKQDSIIIYDENMINVEKTVENIKSFFEDHHVSIPNDCTVCKNKITYHDPIKPYEKCLIDHSSVILNGKILAFPTVYVNIDPTLNTKAKPTHPPETLADWRKIIE
jgi:hypothetical protein